MKKITIVLLAVFTVFILLVSSCDPDDIYLPPIEDCSIICQPPEAIGVDTSGLIEGTDAVFIDVSWTAVTNANDYTLNVYLNGSPNPFETVDVNTTNYTITFLEGLPIGTEVWIEVASNCDCGRSATFTRFVAFYRNGGGTSDIVPYNAERIDICVSPCEYVRFSSQTHTLCNVSSIDLGYANVRYIFYDKDELCGCLDGLNISPSPCSDPITNLRGCLDSTPRYIKTSVNTCP
jgi:hypothetical protein